MSRWRGPKVVVGTFAAVALLGAPFVVTGAQGEELDALPDEFQGVASAAGVSVVTFKEPNPLPVGPGAFLTFETPEVQGDLTANRSTARASLLYPGPAIAGGAALLCTAGAEPFCGQPPPPVLVEAEHPQRPRATLGAGSGEARATARTSMSTAKLAGYRVAAPDPARQAVLDALEATLRGIPGAKRAGDDALLSVGGGTVLQRVLPAGDGRVRAEAKATMNDVRLLAGAVTIDSIVVSSFAVTDGRTVHRSGSSTETAGLLVAGFPGRIGPDGIELAGRGDAGQARQALTGVAARVADAVTMAVDKLDLERRDGAASKTPDGSSAAADGLRVSFGSAPLTETSPPQVSALCSVTGAIQDPLAAGGLMLPPLCAVPDVTGTKDRYVFQLGRSAVTLTAQVFPDFFDGGLPPLDGPDVGGGDGGAPVPPGGVAPGDLGTVGGVDDVAGGDGKGEAVPDLRDATFLAFEARWLGNAADRLGGLYLALVGAVVLLLLLSKVVLRATAVHRGEPSR